MTEKEYVLKLLYTAFLDIRIASYEHDHHTCFVLADIFHNIPLQMNRAEKGERGYEEIITCIRERCEARNCLPWLENARPNMERLP